MCAACAADDDRPTFVTLTLSLCDLDLVSLYIQGVVPAMTETEVYDFDLVSVTLTPCLCVTLTLCLFVTSPLSLYDLDVVSM